jgi:hypothetical protein
MICGRRVVATIKKGCEVINIGCVSQWLGPCSRCGRNKAGDGFVVRFSKRAMEEKVFEVGGHVNR